MQLLLSYSFAVVGCCIYLMTTIATTEIHAHKFCQQHGTYACLTPAAPAPVPAPASASLSTTATIPTWDPTKTKTWLNTTTAATTGSVVCATNMKSCRKFANQCEFQRANCKAATWTPTDIRQCSNLMVGHKGACTCPSASNCVSTNTTVCARYMLRCKKFRNECDYKMARCRGERWLPTNPLYCCQFGVGEARTCRITVTQPTCGTINNKICHHFRNYCDFIGAYQSSNAAYREVGLENCKCLAIGAKGQCGCTRAPE